MRENVPTKTKGQFTKGNIPWNKGTVGVCKPNKTSLKRGTKIGKSTRFKKGVKSYIGRTEIKGEEHYLWKGDDCGYISLHKWVYRNLGRPTKCEHCKVEKKWLHWANKSREYKRDLNDWIRLCPSCHKKYDAKHT